MTEQARDFPRLPGYEVTAVVCEGRRSRIYRARCQTGAGEVMLKLLSPEYVDGGDPAYLRHEYEIMQRLSGEHVVSARALERHHDPPFLVLEDFGGESLDRIARRRPLELPELLRICVQVADGLAGIHAAGVIHKDINPSNIVYNPHTGAAKIIDFGIAAHLPTGQNGTAPDDMPAGSLPYISPEQTGRMDRVVDYRTDFYSLGATLYELLTQRPLFFVDDSVEWLHYHVAKRPQPPADLDPRIPRVLSDIVMRLLAKNAEDRYQSAAGIAADLDTCLEALTEDGDIEPFPLGRKDAAEQFRLPRHLYGREAELERLRAAFERTCAGGTEFVMVRGPAGVGKSVLVQELRRMVNERNGYFASGRFDRLNRHVPYQGLAMALGELCRQLLTESPERLAVWRERLSEALGKNGGLISEIVPELSLILEAPPPPRLPPREAERLFHRLMRNLLHALGRPEHPLVLFLDDEQWIDPATLKLAGIVMGKNRPDHVLLIGAYHDSEVGPDHPLSATVRLLRESDESFTEIDLAPLDHSQLGSLIAETLGSEPEAVRPLADLVHAKTAGNPFFVSEFLSRLYRQGLIVFDSDAGSWRWDTAAIAAEQITDNVVDLLADRLQMLPDETRNLLRLAACLGNDFDSQELALAAESSPDAVARCVREALAADLLMPASGPLPAGEAGAARFVFAHDRVREAIAEFDDETERRRMHLRIGRLLWRQLPAEQRHERLFEFVNHLNIGRALITEADERLRLCRLNLEAARKAGASTAYATALEYLQVAIELLPEDVWSKDYALAFTVHVEAAENAYLCGLLDVMERVSGTALAAITDRVDRSRVQEIRIAALLARSQWSAAADLAWRTMRELGVAMPARPNRLHLLLARALLKWRLRGKTIDDLAKLPAMRHDRLAAAMRIGTQLGTVAFMRQPSLFPMLMYGGVATCAVLGNSEQAVHVYSGYGMLLGTVHNDIPRAQAFGRLAIEIAERLHVNQARARTLLMYNGFIRHWQEPLQDSLEPLLDAYRLAADTGDFEYAGHALNIHGYHAYYSGTHLGAFAEEVAAHRETLAELQQSGMLHHMTVLRQMALNLVGEEPVPLDTDLGGGAEGLEGEAGRDYQFLLSAHTLKTELGYRFRQYDEALASARQARRYLDIDLGLHTVVALHFYEALTCLAIARGRCGWSKRRRLLRRVRRDRRRLRRWNGHNPHDCEHKCCLVDAEAARLRGDYLRAHDLYARAIELALERGFVQEAALACELAAEMHHEAGRDTLAGPYLLRAREAYRHWGAHAKVRDLERRYALLLHKPPVRSAISSTYGDTTTTSTGGTLANVDIASLIKALRAIVDQRVHSRMLEAVINTAIEFAGAQHGALLLQSRDGMLCVEAEASVDGGSSRILQSVPLAAGADVSQAVINYVARTRRGIVVHDAREPHADLPGLDREEYIRRRNVRSILALPILTSANGTEGSRDLIGVLYLENNHASHTFTEARFGVLDIICMAAAGRLELSRRAAIDGLTQLYNREYFEYMLRQELAITGRQNRGLALILSDIDHFKRFNDTWGHQAGDAILEAVAGAVKATVRDADLAARYGGEEIAVILPETGMDEAAEVAERIRQAVAELKVPHRDQALGVTLSLGVACLNTTTTDATALVREADQALYAAKAEGRNRVVTATSRSRSMQ